MAVAGRIRALLGFGRRVLVSTILLYAFMGVLRHTQKQYQEEKLRDHGEPANLSAAQKAGETLFAFVGQESGGFVVFSKQFQGVLGNYGLLLFICAVIATVYHASLSATAFVLGLVDLDKPGSRLHWAIRPYLWSGTWPVVICATLMQVRVAAGGVYLVCIATQYVYEVLLPAPPRRQVPEDKPAVHTQEPPTGDRDTARLLKTLYQIELMKAQAAAEANATAGPRRKK